MRAWFCIKLTCQLRSSSYLLHQINKVSKKLFFWAWVRPGPMGPCPLGQGPAQARAHGPLPIGPGSGPGPWALAHWARVRPGPMGPCPLAHGPWPMGPCPLGPWALAHWGLRVIKNIDFSKSLGMALPGVENVGAPRESILNLSGGPQLPYIKNPKF